MPRSRDPRQRIDAIGFPEESNVGLLLDGNELTILPRPYLFATETKGWFSPRLTGISGGGRRHFGHYGVYPNLADCCVYLWRTKDLPDGEYELLSTIVEDPANAIVEHIRGKVSLTIAYGCILRLALDAPLVAPTRPDHTAAIHFVEEILARGV